VRAGKTVSKWIAMLTLKPGGDAQDIGLGQYCNLWLVPHGQQLLINAALPWRVISGMSRLCMSRVSRTTPISHRILGIPCNPV